MRGNCYKLPHTAIDWGLRFVGGKKKSITAPTRRLPLDVTDSTALLLLAMSAALFCKRRRSRLVR